MSEKRRNNSFKKSVLEVVKNIPKGEVLSYKEVAKRAGNPKAARAVGRILHNNRNPQIPCHRVIKADGKLGGYNRGVKVKLGLLRKEGIIL